MRKNSKKLTLLCVLLMAALVLAGCGKAETGQPNENNQQTAATGPVKILYVEWACATATSNVIANVLENKLGYEVELIPVTAAAMYQGLSTGDGDAILCCWLPLTHGDYMDKVGNKVEDLGPNMHGARIGLVVPEYVDIDSVEALNQARDKFKGEIIGIDPGAGLMKATEKAIEDYNLDYQLVEGSDATMTAALKSATDKNEWVVVTGWVPHWKFARWDLKFLEDPKKVFGEDETINTVVRQGLKEEMPEVYEFFDKFEWTSEDLASAMVMATEAGATSKSAADKWVKANEELVKSWLPEK